MTTATSPAEPEPAQPASAPFGPQGPIADASAAAESATSEPADAPATDAATTHAAPTYTATITFHRAKNLPVADLPSFSSDPYVKATVSFPGSAVPPLVYRTPTVHRTVNPDWEVPWQIANIPAAGLRLDIVVRDEDQGDRDDKLGVCTLETGPLRPGLARDESAGLSVLRGQGGTWVAFARFITAGCMHGKTSALGGVIDVSITVEGHTAIPAGGFGVADAAATERITRAYTVGPNWWSQHSSPLIGKITSTSAAGTDGIAHYDFIANKLQLTGPLPAALNQRYVAFAPFVRAYFTSSGLRGKLLHVALKKQFRTIYSANSHTQYGVVPPLPEPADPRAVGRRFLEMAHWGEGGRLFTYVITLDAEWRFTETGPEFGIQMLSKHTMHSNVSKDVAFAGEMFVRRIRHQRHEDPPETDPAHTEEAEAEAARHSIDDYELVIDNDSGTYRPPAEHLPLLQKFLEANLGGVKVSAANGLDEKHAAEKKAHVQQKERAGRRRFQQPSSPRSSSDADGSISSSDEEELTTGRVGMGRQMKRRALGLDDPAPAGPAGDGEGDGEGQGQGGKGAALKDHAQKWINGVAGTGMLEREEMKAEKREDKRKRKEREKEAQKHGHAHPHLHLHHKREPEDDGEKEPEPEPPRGD